MKPDWDFLLDEASFASLLPSEYARFVRPIRDGMTLFLSGLPAAQQASILAAQAALPLDASFSHRFGILARSSPVLQKLGQILARDRRLAAELRAHLRELESLTPSVPLESVVQTLTEELGPLEPLGITVEESIAEASVAVVVSFRQQTPAGQEVARGVFKVLKPGIEKTLQHELELVKQVGQYLDDRCDELQIPHLDYEETFEQVREKLQDEVQLENEQRHLAQAAVFFAHDRHVHVPRLLEHCSPRVTAMERLSGDKVTNHALDSPRRKRRLARLVARSLIAKPIFSKSDQPMFHGDPHAGNLFLTDEGRLGILDWSLTGTLGVRERIAIVQIILGAVALDEDRIIAVLRPLADPRRLDEPALRTVVGGWVKRVRRGQFPGLSWLVGMLDQAVHDARLRVGTDMMLFRKSLLTLEGVVAEVGGCEGQIDKTLSLEFLRHFAAEYPQRWVQLPDSREFSTRLSNLDLTRAWLCGPATVTRFWTGHALDILDACAKRWEASLAEGSAVTADSPVDLPTD